MVQLQLKFVKIINDIGWKFGQPDTISCRQAQVKPFTRQGSTDGGE